MGWDGMGVIRSKDTPEHPPTVLQRLAAEQSDILPPGVIDAILNFRCRWPFSMESAPQNPV